MSASLCIVILVIAVACAVPAATVWVASPWERVLRGTAAGGTAQKVEIQAASNEYEPFRVIVRAAEKPLRDVQVSAGYLGGEKVTIPPENITLYRPHYIHVFEPSHRSEAPPGWYPDPLIPFTDPEDGSELSGADYDAAVFDVQAGHNGQIWADVYVPAGTPAGTYNGTVTVAAAGTEIATIPVELKVWDFELPDAIAMRSCFGSLGGRLARGLDMKAGSDEFRRVEDLYIDTLLAHRAVPGTLGNIWPDWNRKTGNMDDSDSGERLRRMIEKKHVNALRIPFRYRNKPDKCKEYLSALADYLRQRGWLDMAYVYMHDEPNNAEEYQTVRKQGALIQKADPDIKRLCTEQTITSNEEWGDLYGAVDIWCPLWGLFDEKTAKQRLHKGEKLWSYTALCQRDRRNPFWEIDFAPVNYRAPFWVSWHYDITGFLYWSSVYWEYENVWEKPHFRDKFWGEGMLLYPGGPAGIDGPVTSMRLKLIREAFEDYEYMTMAAETAGDGAVDDITDGIATSFQDWSRKPQEYMQARRQLADLIVENK